MHTKEGSQAYKRGWCYFDQILEGQTLCARPQGIFYQNFIFSESYILMLGKWMLASSPLQTWLATTLHQKKDRWVQAREIKCFQRIFVKQDQDLEQEPLYDK